jgi:uncharacterized membrane protein
MKPKRELITFKKEDEHFYSLIVGIVQIKKLTGIRTSFSYELIRLAKNGLGMSLKGTSLDRKIIDGLDKKTT